MYNTDILKHFLIKITYFVLTTKKFIYKFIIFSLSILKSVIKIKYNNVKKNKNIKIKTCYNKLYFTKINYFLLSEKKL